MQAELRLGQGIHVSRKRVRRLMRQAGISGLVKVKRGQNHDPGARRAGSLMTWSNGKFRPDAPNVLWVADITYLRTWEGWLYLAAVQDAYSRRIVGWAMTEHMRTELVADALQMAVHRRRPEPGLIHHSDQGSQYVALGFGQQARDAGIAVSMGSKGDCLRQRRRRELLRDPEEGARSPPVMARADATCARPSSTTSRRSTTDRDDTPPSDTSPQRNTRTPQPQRQRRPSD